ncbi:hypothetical protein EHF36_07935 [Kerstersia gyiorum]|uniref:hypothetical protein n=1 Tax=Kerstersia gyiorum TaxID=206506 RepID=UPI0010712485|nr:hypothetical protein [Kerstersia gyiorum]QBR40564.1 hypothetical protein EHF36_07935 [Kerstersia gyiorum]
MPELLASSPDETVYIVEGEKDADRLASLHLVATCNSGGAGKWSEKYSQHLKGRNVIILPDNDEPGREHAALVAKSLTGVAASITVLALPGLPEKGDVSDWLDAGHTVAELMDLAIKQRAITDQATGDSDTRQRQSQTDVIVAYVQERFHLVHDSSKTPYAVGREDGICSRLQGRAFRDAVLSGFFRTHSTAVRDAAWREALMTLCAVARDGKPRTVHLRVADLGEDEHVIDLGEPDNGRCVILRPGRWEVHAKAPVLFVRPEGMEPLPIPVSGGSIQALWECANIPKNARLMVVAWLIEAMRESTPYPGIELVGEQGSGKSFTAKLLRRLIDPNACDLRGAPRSVEDIFVSGGVSHVLTFENLTHLHSNIQDALCIASTGGGHARRTLYTDADETVIQMKRPWIVNGISVAITQQDLIDRTLSIDLPVIEARNASTDLWRHFVRHQASIIGAVLDIAAKALALMPEMPPLPHDERPRLIEFANLGRSVAVALGDAPENFMTQFNAARSEAVARVLDGSPVASAILDWVGANPLGREQPVKAWMHDLEHYRPLGAEAWPKSPKGLGDAMRRSAPALRQMGIECKCLGKIGGAVKWEIKQKLPSISASPANATGLNNAALDQDIRTCRTSSEQLLSVKSAKTPDSLASENAPASSTAPDKQEVF